MIERWRRLCRATAWLRISSTCCPISRSCSARKASGSPPTGGRRRESARPRARLQRWRWPVLRRSCRASGGRSRTRSSRWSSWVRCPRSRGVVTRCPRASSRSSTSRGWGRRRRRGSGASSASRRSRACAKRPRRRGCADCPASVRGARRRSSTPCAKVPAAKGHGEHPSASGCPPFSTWSRPCARTRRRSGCRKQEASAAAARRFVTWT